MNHKGLSHYASDIATNASLGQAGCFVLLTSMEGDVHVAGKDDGTGDTYYPGVGQFVAIKNVSSPTHGIANASGAIEVKVECWVGKAGVRTDETTLAQASFFLSAGDIVYGPFRSVELENGGTLGKLLVYLG